MKNCIEKIIENSKIEQEKLIKNFNDEMTKNKNETQKKVDLKLREIINKLKINDGINQEDVEDILTIIHCAKYVGVKDHVLQNELNVIINKKLNNLGLLVESEVEFDEFDHEHKGVFCLHLKAKIENLKSAVLNNKYKNIIETLIKRESVSIKANESIVEISFSKNKFKLWIFNVESVSNLLNKNDDFEKLESYHNNIETLLEDDLIKLIN